MRQIGFTTFALCLLGIAAPIHADPILNGGFEANFANWATLGLTSIETAAYGTAPVEGTQQARLSRPFSGWPRDRSTRW
jgi:hypothetical protein